MKTNEIAPGSILQRIYLKERLNEIVKGIDGKKFIEVGAGTGYTSEILLSKGFTGIGYDLNRESCELNSELNKNYINAGLYEVSNDNFLNINYKENKIDLIISSMVIEHLSEQEVDKYFSKCFELLSKNGILISLVPANMSYWGIEDEIAGHYKRYSFNCFKEIGDKFSYSIIKCEGLTFPVSNFLFPISNYLIKKSESKKKDLTKKEQTILSSNRKVMLKTDFPKIFNLILNEITMYPLHVLQKMFKRNKNSMVIYCEMRKKIA